MLSGNPRVTSLSRLLDTQQRSGCNITLSVERTLNQSVRSVNIIVIYIYDEFSLWINCSILMFPGEVEMVFHDQVCQGVKCKAP